MQTFYNRKREIKMMVCKCGYYMIWKMAYKYGVPITWWECPNCGNNTKYSYTWSDRTEPNGLRGKQHD